MKLFLTLCIFISMTEFSYAQDWANTARFQIENDSIRLPTKDENRVVFMGNSITEGWKSFRPEFFENKSFVNRGIGGQTTPQMLVRFRQDVIALKPKVVIILAGVNDIAGNTGPSTLEMIMDNIISMAELAKANDIKVILSSVLPAFDFSWRPGLEPSTKIIALNKMIKEYADENEIVYLDYFSAMVDERNGLKDGYTYDGVHPNEAGYKAMEPLALEAIAKALTEN
uniref:SGNH/GDSL hydrolase family protein n=1 Tax=Fulvivirga sp. TaxID=1931237 RepID=UPI00404B5676